MLCPQCKASVDANDRFCPKCGAGVSSATARSQAAAGTPITPPVVSAQPTQGSRVTELRTPVPEGGQKYHGLGTAAKLMIKSADVIRIICYVLAGLSFVSCLMIFREKAALGFVLGLISGLIVALFGWMAWLGLTVWGELMYVVIDVEENMRRHV